jgi:hypothetical protein
VSGELIRKLEIPINVRDKQRAGDWYAEKLGIFFGADDRADVSGSTVVLFDFASFVPASHVIYQFVTTDLVRAHAILKGRGVEVSEIPEANWNFTLKDPDGNGIVFYEPR